MRSALYSNGLYKYSSGQVQQLAQQQDRRAGHRQPSPAPVIRNAQIKADSDTITPPGRIIGLKHAPPKNRWSPDVYAQKYIPKSLVAVNESPIIGTIHGRHVGGVDFLRYALSFAGIYFLDPLPSIRLSVSCEASQPTTLCPKNYNQFLVYHDLDVQAQTHQIQNYNLYNVPLKSIDPIQNIYELCVPGLREGTPGVAIGDIVLMRQLLVNPKTSLPWDEPDVVHDASQPSPGFTGYQLVPVICGIDKMKERLMLQVNGITTTSPVCNVRFVVQPRRTSAIQEAVEDISTMLQGPAELATSSNDWVRCMLFPSKSNGVYTESLPVGVFGQTWVDRELNYEQKVSHDTFCILLDNCANVYLESRECHSYTEIRQAPLHRQRATGYREDENNL